MSLNIAGFIKQLLPSFNKSDIETDLEISLETMPIIFDVYGSLESILKVAPIKDKRNKEIIDKFYKELHSGLEAHKVKVKLSPSKNIASDTLTLFKNVNVNGKYLFSKIEDALNDVVVSQALTAYRANLLRAVPHYYFLTKFALDFANFLYVNEAENGGLELTKESKLNKKQLEFITKNAWLYASVLSLYSAPNDALVDKLDNIDEIYVPSEEVDNVVEIYSSNKVDMFNNLPSGFIGSPIYSIRLIFAQWESDRYRKMKDQKKLLELRYLHLKLLQETGKTDVAMEKEIEHLQKRITDLDFKLAKIEDSLE